MLRGGGTPSLAVGTRAGLRGMVGASVHSVRGVDVATPWLRRGYAMAGCPGEKLQQVGCPATPSWPHWPPAPPRRGSPRSRCQGQVGGHARPGLSSTLRRDGQQGGGELRLLGPGTEGPRAGLPGAAWQGAQRRRHTGVSVPSCRGARQCRDTAELWADAPGSLRVTCIPPTPTNAGPGPERGQQTSPSWDARGLGVETGPAATLDHSRELELRVG